MRLEISEPIIYHVNKFIVQVNVMHGDGDSYENLNVIIDGNRTDILEEVVTVLETMKKLPWNSACELYDKQPMFLLYFRDEFLGDYMDRYPWPEKYKDIDDFDELLRYVQRPIWPREQYSDHYARLDSYRVYFYDENGNKRDVKILKD